MTVGLSPAAANAILDALCRSVAWSEPAALYLKLHTGDPGAAGTANAAGETTRKQITFGNPASGGTISNTVALLWTNVSTTETYSHFSLWDAASGGNFQGSDDFTAPRAVGAGDNFEIPIGDVDVSFNVAA